MIYLWVQKEGEAEQCVQYFPCKWHSEFTVHVPKLVTAELLLFMKSKSTTNA